MKVLKTVAIIVGAVALVVTGVGLAAGLALGEAVGLTAGFFGLSGALGTALVVGTSLLALSTLFGALIPKPSQGGNQTRWKADPYAGLPYVMGRTLVAGNIVYRRGSGGNNDFEHFVTVLSIGPIAAISATFMNKTTVSFDGGGNAIGTYHNLIWQDSLLGACPESRALAPRASTAPGWTADHKLSGLAATMLSFKYDSSSANGLTSEPAPAWIVEGRYVYDPRHDSTYPGGSGSCRAADPSTWVWSENPQLHGLTWAIGSFQNGVRVAGIGAAATHIDVASFVEGANLSDARGWKVGGQVVTRPDTLWNSLKLILQAGGSAPVLVGGVITCINRAPRVSLATITRADIVGACSFSGTQPRRNRINGIIPQYRSEVHDWQMVSATGVSVADYVTEDGDERTQEIAYPLVQDVDQVAQLAAYDICDAREAGPGSVGLKPWWLNYKIGDCVTFNPEDGWSVKVLVTGRSIDASSGIVGYDFHTETDAKHDFALGVTGQAPPTASISYSTGVAAPGAGVWTATGVTLTANGASVPALVATGAVETSSAEAVLFDYRLYATGLPDDTGWIGAATEAPTVTRREFTSVTPGTQYQIGVRYRVRGVIGARRILGPVTAGQLSVARGSYTLLSRTVAYPLSSTSSSITIAAFDGVLDDGAGYAFAADSVTGLAASTSYGIFADRASGAYSAEAAPATSAFASSANIFVGWQSTADGGGTYPSGGTPPGGWGGDGGYVNYF